MNSFTLFLVLAISSTLASLYAIPKQLSAISELGIDFSIPRSPAVMQGIVLSVSSSAVGVALRRVTAFSLFGGGERVLTIIITTGVGVAGHLILYYAVFRPRIPHHEFQTMEAVRLKMGILARIVQGGIVEEVQFRWGLMSLIAAPLIFLTGSQSLLSVPIAIVISAVIFAQFHLAGARQLGIGRGKDSKTLVTVDNIWGSVLFGWLFWQYGLVAAILSHALFHVIWFFAERSLTETFQGTNETH